MITAPYKYKKTLRASIPLSLLAHTLLSTGITTDRYMRKHGNRKATLYLIFILPFLSLMPEIALGQDGTNYEVDLETTAIIYNDNLESLTLYMPPAYDAKYIRWKLLKDNAQESLATTNYFSNSNYQLSTDNNYFCWSGENNPDVKHVTYTLPDGETLGNRTTSTYKVVCEWTDVVPNEGEEKYDHIMTWTFFKATGNDHRKIEEATIKEVDNQRILYSSDKSQKIISLNISEQYEKIKEIIGSDIKYIRLVAASNVYDSKGLYMMSNNDMYQTFHSESGNNKNNSYVAFLNKEETKAKEAFNVDFTVADKKDIIDFFSDASYVLIASEAPTVTMKDGSSLTLKEPATVYKFSLIDKADLSNDITTSELPTESDKVFDKNVYVSKDDETVTVTIDKKVINGDGNVTTPFYLRWFVVKKDDETKKTVIPATFSSADTDYKSVNSGYYWYFKESGTDVDESIFTVTLDKPTTGEWSDYKLICVTSTNNIGDEYEEFSGYLQSEPTLDLMFMHSFIEKSSLEITDAINTRNKIEQEAYVKRSSTSNTIAFPEESATGIKYIRWFLSKKAPVEQVQDASKLSNSSYTSCANGLFKYDVNGLNEDLDVTIDGLTGTELIDGYELHCLISTDLSKLTEHTEGYVDQEPDISKEYVFSFKAEGDIEENIPDGLEILKTYIDYVDEADKNYTAKIKLTDIIDAFKKNSTTEIETLYLRWYAEYKDSGKDYNLTPVNEKIYIVSNLGPYWYSKFADKSLSDMTESDFDVTFTVPDGKKICDYKLVLLMSNSEDGAILSDKSLLKTEPTIQAQFIYELRREILDRPFVHYEGIANAKGEFNSNGTQKVHEVDYYYYMNPGDSVELTLPIQNYNLSDGTNAENYEPQGFFRWYEWDTDKGSGNIAPTQYTGTKEHDNYKTKLYAIKDENGGDKGLCAFNINKDGKADDKDNNPNRYNVGVTYKAPKAEEGNWEGETIACDVSRYIDGIDETHTYMTHEPTLSIRYKFHIRPAEVIAAEVRDSLISSNLTNSYSTYEDHNYLNIGVKDEDSKVTLRLQNNNLGMYYYYPLTADGLKKMLYHRDGDDNNNDFTAEDFTNDLTQAKSMTWVIFDERKEYYKAFISTNEADEDLFVDKKLFKFSINDLNDNTKNNWIKTDEDVTSPAPEITTTSRIFIVVYLGDGSATETISEETTGLRICPVANYSCRFITDYPMLFENLPATRTLDYLKNNYYLATNVISIDDLSETQTYATPTKENNMSDKPGAWDRRHYGFVYKELKDYRADNPNDKGHYNSPLHGEYGIYKSAGVPNVSQYKEKDTDKSEAEDKLGYAWFSLASDDTEFYDRTHQIDESQYGYFLYFDASDEARPVASADFEADLCPGSVFAISAAVANLARNNTSKEAPQLMLSLYGHKADGTISREPIETFATCDFSTVGATELNKWYQIFAKITMPSGLGVENYNKFRLIIDNYCKSTDGADYAIDDIRIYKKVAAVEAIQNKPLCSDNLNGDVPADITMKFRIEYESLLAKSELNTSKYITKETRKLYYRIVDEEGTPVITNYDEDSEETTGYGWTTFYRKEKDASNMTNPVRIEEDGQWYCILTDKNFKDLKPGKKYYISTAFGEFNDEDPLTEEQINNLIWGNPLDACTTYSGWFEVQGQSLVVNDTNGNLLTDITVECEQEEVTNSEITVKLQIPDPRNGGVIELSDCPFDWFIGTYNEFSSAIGLQEALEAFRTEYPTGPFKSDGSDKTSAKGIFKEDHFKLMKEYVEDNKKLITNASAKLTSDDYTFTVKDGDYHVCAKPIVSTENKISVNDVEYEICPELMEFQFKVVKDGPKIYLGFNDETYPNTTYYRTVRMGLKQIEGCNENRPLKLPINKTQAINGTSTTLNISDDIVLSDSNDPEWESKKGLSVAEIVKFKDTTISHKEAEDEQRTIDIYFNESSDFKEGYWYEFQFSCTQSQENTDATTTSCKGETFFRINVVPEYVTWSPTADNGMNNNWNNDLNWQRSTKDDLGKDEYPTYNETPNSFIPMDFTKVLIKENSPYPYLAYLQKMNTGRLTNLSNGMYNATEDVEYDIMVSSYFSNDGNGEYYGCEKFYGNKCKEIYFKPGGELRNQQYLEYEKAWVDMEINTNQWYVLGSPLKDIYAGDMYVPYATGREDAEAFTDITFDDSKHSRNRYPVYQRVWDREEVYEITETSGNHEAYHKPTDIPESISLDCTLWSHAYNDMSVPYNGKGFSIKAGDDYYPTKEQNQTGKSLIRLPKADNEYYYYKNDDTKSDIKKELPSKNIKENLIIGKATENEDKGEYIFNLTDNKTEGNLYYLIYNPYVATLDMKRFFDNNENKTILDGTNYWTIKENATETGNSQTLIEETDGYISPTQAFFVKAKADVVNGTVKFDASMTVDPGKRKGISKSSSSVNILRLTASGNNGCNMATIVLKPCTNVGFDSSEDAEILYDSNLKEIPLLYTVADSKAVAINTMPEISWLPMGVIADNNENVELCIKGTGNLDTSLYLYDAAEKAFTELTDNSCINIESNAYGRYFLTTYHTAGIEENMECTSVSCYSYGNGMLVVSASSANQLYGIEIYTIDGKLIKKANLTGLLSWKTFVSGHIVIVRINTSNGMLIKKILLSAKP